MFLVLLLLLLFWLGVLRRQMFVYRFFFYFLNGNNLFKNFFPVLSTVLSSWRAEFPFLTGILIRGIKVLQTLCPNHNQQTCSCSGLGEFLASKLQFWNYIAIRINFTFLMANFFNFLIIPSLLFDKLY